VSRCFEYGVETSEAGPRVGEPPPTLCLQLQPTEEARALEGEDPASAEVSAYDIQYELNRGGFKPYDLPKDLDLEGIEIVSASWQGREVESAGDEPVPRQPNAVSPAQLQREKEGARGDRDRLNDPGDCIRPDAETGGEVPHPPNPEVRIERFSSWIEAEYEFAELPEGHFCHPIAVVGVLYAGDPTEPRFATSQTRTRVTGLTGKLIVPLRPLRGQAPERLDVSTQTLSGWASEPVRLPLD